MKEIIIVSEKRKKVSENICPVDFIVNLGQPAKSCGIALDKKCISRLMLGRMTKDIHRNGNNVSINWPETGEVMEFEEIRDTHTYLISKMKVKLQSGEIFEFECPSGEISIIILE